MRSILFPHSPNKFGGFVITTVQHIFRGIASGYFFQHQLVVTIAAQRSLWAKRASDGGAKAFPEHFVGLFQHTRSGQDLNVSVYATLELEIDGMPNSIVTTLHGA